MMKKIKFFIFIFLAFFAVNIISVNAEDVTATVTVSPSTSYTVSFNGNGATSGSTASQTAPAGDDIILNTNGFLRTNYSFNGWNTNSAGTDLNYSNQATYTMGSANQILYAKWTPSAVNYLLTVTNNRPTTIVTSEPTGIACGTGATNCTESYAKDTEVKITAPKETGYSVTISGGCSASGGVGVSATCNVIMSSDSTVNVIYTAVTTQYLLTVTNNMKTTVDVTSIPAGITCGSDCTESYDSGKSVKIEAPALAGYTVAISGGCTATGSIIAGNPTGASCSVIMNSVKTVNVVYSPIQHLLTVTNNRTVTPYVTSSPTGISCGSDCTELYNQGTKVTITAPAVSNYSVSISNGCVATGAVGLSAFCEVTMDSAKTVDVVYTINGAKTPSTCWVTNPSVVYNGSQQTAGVATSPTGGTITNIKYNGSTTKPTNPGTYPITINFVPPNTTTHTSLTDGSCGNFVINKITSPITLTSQTVVNPTPFANPLTVGGDSVWVGAVTYVIEPPMSAGCFLSGSNLNYGVPVPGSCIVRATKAGNTFYNSATTTGTFTINLPGPSVTLTASPASVAPGGTSALTWVVTGSPTQCGALPEGGSYTAWGGVKSKTGGSENVTVATTSTYGIQCDGVLSSATVTVNPIVPPSSSKPDLKAEFKGTPPSSVKVGEYFYLPATISNISNTDTPSTFASVIQIKRPTDSDLNLARFGLLQRVSLLKNSNFELNPVDAFVSEGIWQVRVYADVGEEIDEGGAQYKLNNITGWYTIQVNPATPPVGSDPQPLLEATPVTKYNGKTTLSWRSTSGPDAVCKLSGGEFNPLPGVDKWVRSTSASLTTSALKQTTVFTMTCGSKSSSVTVTVPAPDPNFDEN